jgi:hypothetical protein
VFFHPAALQRPGDQEKHGIQQTDAQGAKKQNPSIRNDMKNTAAQKQGKRQYGYRRQSALDIQIRYLFYDPIAHTWYYIINAERSKVFMILRNTKEGCNNFFRFFGRAVSSSLAIHGSIAV